MSDPHWYVEVRGRSEAEVRDRIAAADQGAVNQGWQRTAPESTVEGDTLVVRLVYDKLPSGTPPLWLFLGVIIFVVLVLYYVKG